MGLGLPTQAQVLKMLQEAMEDSRIQKYHGNLSVIHLITKVEEEITKEEEEEEEEEEGEAEEVEEGEEEDGDVDLGML